MADILNLTDLTAISSDDYLPVYKTVDLDLRKVTVATLLEFIQEQINIPNNRLVKQVSNVTAPGFTVEVDDIDLSVWLFINEETGYVSGTVVLPLTPVNQQQIRIKINHACNVLTIDGNGKSTVPATIEIPDEVSARLVYTYMYDEPTRCWYSNFPWT